MKTREHQRLVSGCTNAVLSLPRPPPSNAGVSVQQINHRKSEGLLGGRRLCRIPFEGVPEEQVVLETLCKKLVPRSEGQVHLKVVGQEEDSVDR